MSLDDDALDRPHPGPGVDRAFISKLGRLETFYAVTGRVPSQREVMDDGFQVGQWVDSLRRSYRRGTLHPEKAALIEARFADWDWGVTRQGPSTKPYDFDTMLSALWEVADETGAPPVAVLVVETADGTLPVGAWAHRKKRALLNGTLPDHEAEALCEIPGFGVPAARRTWWGYYELLSTFDAENEAWPGLDDICMSEDGPVAIGKWARSQRFSRGRRRLNPSKMAAIEALPSWPGWPKGSIE